MGQPVDLVLAGDVMTGRGVDQILAHPGLPTLHEEYVKDARRYVDLAQAANGAVPVPVPPTWPWGELGSVGAGNGPAWRVMNLETSVTRSDDWAPGKPVHYRMSPDNVDCLRDAGTDVWTLANNHVLDFGVRGLVETLGVLHAAGQRTAGAGMDLAQAWAPAVAETRGRRLLVWAACHASSGVRGSWAATPDRPGVAWLPDLDDRTAARVADRVREQVRPGDLVVFSVHWGGNWGYDVGADQRRFAHRLVDAGVHVVHGHSSHHPKGIETHHGGLVLYGCGDLVDDYEGISGYEQFRDDLRLVYVASIDPQDEGLLRLRMVPFQSRRMRLERAGTDDARWLAERLSERSGGLGVWLADDGELHASFQ